MAIQTVQDLMTSNPKCCTPQDAVDVAARLMVDCDCGSIPVVDDSHTLRPIGIITDRDIACRVVAQGWSAACRVQDVMTPEPTTMGPETSIHDCTKVMEQLQIRRMLIADDDGKLIGIIAQADIARAGKRDSALERELAELVEEVSEPARVT